MLSLWLIIILNFVISAWNSYAAGVLWETDDGLLYRFVAGSVLVQGFVGMAYTSILTAIASGHLGTEYLVSTNVVLGIPLIASGLVILVQSWVNLIRNRSLGSFLVTMWNSFAIVWNIFAWLESVKAAGGVIPAAEDLVDDGDARLVVLLAAGVSVLLSYGLFKVGRERAKKA